MKKLLLIFFGCLACNGFALERRVTDGPHFGFVTGGDTQGEEFVWGWQGAYDFSKVLTAELSYSRHSDAFPAAQIRRLGLPPGSGVEFESNAIALSGRWHIFSGNYHSFYLGAGGSYHLLNEDAKEVNRAIAANGGNSIFSDFSAEIHKGFGYHAAVGAELSLHENWELFAEYRYVAFDTDVDFRLIRTAANGSLVTTEVDDVLSYDHELIRIGVNYRF
jgi:opacity protein-like surface antigen